MLLLSFCFQLLLYIINPYSVEIWSATFQDWYDDNYSRMSKSLFYWNMVCDGCFYGTGEELIKSLNPFSIGIWSATTLVRCHCVGTQ